LKKNLYRLFSDKILDTPLWIKQVIFFELAKNLGKDCQEFSDVLSVYSPILSFKGQSELLDKKCGLDSNIYAFLQYCAEGYNFLEIGVNMFLSMEETAKYYEFCIEQEFINKPESNFISAAAEYISGKLRLGEYLLKIGKIDKNELDDAVSLYNTTNDKRFGEVLVHLEYVKKDDLKTILILKDEARKRFVLDYNAISQVNAECVCEEQKLSEEFNSLKLENKKLKNKLTQLLGLVKSND